MSFLRNTEVKRIIIKFMLLQITFACILAIFFNLNMQSLKRDVMKQNIAAAGKIIIKHPEIKNDIIPCFTKGYTESEFTAGEKVLKEYGYDDRLPFRAVAVIGNFYNKFLYNSIFLMVLFFIISFFIVISEYKIIFNKISDMSSSAEAIVEGNSKFKRIPENGEGELSLLVHNFNEMSNRLDLTIQALQREKIFLKDTISDISHQLKTPLSSLMVFNELILDGRVAKEQYMNLMEKSKEQLQRMEWLIINLLKLAKMEAGTIELKMINAPLIETIQKSLSPLLISIESKEQKLIINEKVKKISMRHDSNWLSEAFTNIIKNCIEHTGFGGEIYIEIDETPLMVNVFIRDNGEGITKEDLPHIFERFYKAGDKGSSVGIGLSLAKTIIEKHGGSIKAKSSIGNGTEFSITFLKI